MTQQKLYNLFRIATSGQPEQFGCSVYSSIHDSIMPSKLKLTSRIAPDANQVNTLKATYLNSTGPKLSDQIDKNAIISEKWINVIFPHFLPSPRFVIKVREDNQSCIAMAQNPKFSPQTKHIAIKYHHFRKHVITQSNPNGFLDIDYCSTDDQISDIFTKPVCDDIFMRLRQMLLVW